MRARVFDQLNGWVDRHFMLVLGTLAAAVALTLVKRAIDAPFWHDEIYTILAARLPLLTLWTASRDGLDLAPPLNSALTHVVRALAGEGLIATRVPAMLGFLAAFVAIAVTVRRHANALIGLAAAVMLCYSAAYVYAIEARGYGLVTACFAIALGVWLAHARGAGGRWALAGLTVSLAAGLWTHYYFAFAFLPICCGEIVRQYSRRQFDGSVWIAIALALVAASPLWWLVRSNMSYAETFWGRLQPPDVRATYEFLLGTLIGSRFRAVAAVITMLLVVGWIRRTPGSPARRLPGHLTTAALVCLAIPVIAIFAARTIGHDVFAPRYAMFATAGLVIALSLVVWRFGPSNGVVDIVLCTVLMLFFVRTLWRTFEGARHAAAAPMTEHALLGSRVNAGAVTVVTGGTRFLEFWYDTPEDRRNRLVYLAEPSAELSATGTDVIDRGYLALARWTDVRVQDVPTFLANERDFVLYDAGEFWQKARLRALGASLEEIGRDDKGVLYRVRQK